MKSFYTAQSFYDKKKPVFDYYVVDKSNVIHVIKGNATLLNSEAKKDFLNVIDKFNLIKADDVENPLDYKKTLPLYKENNMNKVKVITRSYNYEREDIETALNTAYDDYGYVLDKMIANDDYIILYLKEEPVE